MNKLFEFFKPEDCVQYESRSSMSPPCIPLDKANRLLNESGFPVYQHPKKGYIYESALTAKAYQATVEALIICPRPIEPEVEECGHNNGQIIVCGQTFDIDHDFCPKCGKDLRNE